MDKKKTGLMRLLELSGRKKGLLVFSAVLATMHALLTMVPYALVFHILTGLLKGSPQDIHALLIWAFGAVGISLVLIYLSAMASHIAAFDILYGLRCAIADRLGRLPMGYLRNQSSGALKKIIVDDVERVEMFIAHGLPDTVRAVMLPVITLGFLFTVDYRLALMSVVPLILLIVIVSLILGAKAGKAMAKKYHASLEEMNGGIVEFVRAMPVMKIFGQSASAFSKYSGTVKAFDHDMKDWTRLTAPAWGMTISFINNALLPVLAFGLYLYFQGRIELSVFLLFLILGVGYIRPAFKLTALIFDIIMISQGVDRMDEILFEAQTQKSGSAALPKDFSLKVQNARFAYVKGIDVIRDISFDVPRGSITALVGPSGSGKSTAAQLIARFYDLDAGAITLGGVNIKKIPMQDLMAHIGFVFQDNYMFRQSLHDNISMGKNHTRQEVITAAKTARCHDFISRLPMGYDTCFGDRGVHLSGGEQQRIQLARVVLKDAPVLILDEATAFSDPENESLIMTAINELIENKTVIIIAHRLSTITGTDQIVVFDKGGEINAVGQHNQLLNESDLYAKMWRAHSRAREFEIEQQQPEPVRNLL